MSQSPYEDHNIFTYPSPYICNINFPQLLKFLLVVFTPLMNAMLYKIHQVQLQDTS